MNSVVSTNQVFVLKSNVNHPDEVLKLNSILDGHPMIMRWTVDLEDIDRVIRIESHTGDVDDFITLIASTGIACSELE